MQLHSDKSRKDITRDRHYRTIAVDARRGIYASRLTLRGPSNFIHVKKISSGENSGTTCDNGPCREAQLAAFRGDIACFECDHARSIQYAEDGVEINLDDKSLESMVALSLISENKANSAKALKEHARSKNSALCVYLPLARDSTEATINLSIHTKDVRYYSRLSRTIVSYDKRRNTLSCRCCRIGRHCSHKAVGKWYLFQDMPDLLQKQLPTDTELDDENSRTLFDDDGQEDLQGSSLTTPEISMSLDERMVTYISQAKKYPVDTNTCITLRLDVLPVKIVPKEERCHLCEAAVSEPLLVTRHGKIVFKNCIVKGNDINELSY